MRGLEFILTKCTVNRGYFDNFLPFFTFMKNLKVEVRFISTNIGVPARPSYPQGNSCIRFELNAIERS